MTTELPEVSLLHQVAAGEPGAMDKCMDRFGGLVWSLARRLALGGSDADDAVQEIFIDVWRSAARFNPEIASETTFVAMIARRRLIDRGRRRQRRIDASTLPDALQPAAAPIPDAPERDDDAGRATAALEKLRPEQQQVLQLAIYHGCSHEEIARSTGLPLGTVKTHARRGLIRLREILESEGALTEGHTGAAVARKTADAHAKLTKKPE
ncbi:MAG: sigma-70 family RNA polymerase sigma factor [Planctomycetota bacterium]|nr:sigma-70 family RNA polymerase sigma factor [Planctomycetota bacterium]